VEVQILTTIAGLRSTSLTELFKIITSFGDLKTVLVLSLVVSLIFLARRKYVYTKLLLLSLALDVIIVYSLKLLIQRARPLSDNLLVVEPDFSFPSGHAFIAVSFYGLLAYLLIKKVKQTWLKLLIATAAICLILLIGFSRLYLGVHWPSDVAASLVLATGVVIAITKYFLPVLSNRARLP